MSLAWYILDLRLNLSQNFSLHAGNHLLKYLTQFKYAYHVFLLTLFRDFNFMSEQVAKSASKALGSVISKVKKCGVMLYNCFVQLFDTHAWSIINHGAGIWGMRSFTSIDDTIRRACRFFIGVKKQALLAAVTADMGLLPPTCRQAVAVTRLFQGMGNCQNSQDEAGSPRM